MTGLLATRQADFAAALLDPTRAVPMGLIAPACMLPTRRFNVYRNNVVASLTRALRAAFPATARLVGEPFFAVMCRVYISDEPPASPLLFDYGRSLPDFIETFEPAASLPYLPDIARIERAWVESYHAHEAKPLGPAVFAQVSPQDLPHLRVALHPSLRIVSSPFPALTIWQRNINHDETPVNLTDGGETVLIVRPNAAVELRSLPHGGADFLQALSSGLSMLEASSSAQAADGRFDLASSLSGLIAAGAFTAISAS